MQYNILTLFPEYFNSAFSCGLLGKALEEGLVEVNLVNPRDFAPGKHHCVDDRPYGGGPGMVMALEPLSAALKSLSSPGRIVALNPKGRPLTQALAAELSAEPCLTLVCGRYEGIDARLEELFPIENLSLGDYVLSGGETGALTLIEAVSRLLPGFMGHADSGEEESFSAGLLEYPHYTRPEEYQGLRVPEILLSGDHARVAAWRREKSLEATLEHRPELLAKAELSVKDVRHIRKIPRMRAGRNLYFALVHAPVLNKFGEIGTVSLTNLDIHDIARVCRSYDMGGYFICTPLEDQKELGLELIRHWTQGSGRDFNPDRAEAMSLVRVVSSLEDAALAVSALHGVSPAIVASSAKSEGGLSPRAVREMLADSPVLLALGTGSGLAPQVLEMAQATLLPIRPFSRYNHLAVRSAAAILADRILGDLN